MLLAIGSVRVRQCTPLEGLTFMLLGPLVGVALAGITGLWVGSTFASGARTPSRSRRVAVLAGTFPVAALGLGLYRFWSTPTISIYGAYAGWFPGTIYDEDVALTPIYVSQRVLVLRGAYIAGEIKPNGDTGELSLKWEGSDGEELPA